MSNFDDHMRELRKGKPLVDLLRDSEIGCPHSCLCDAAADEIEQLRAALTEAETVMMIVEPRSHKAAYLAALASIRAALKQQSVSKQAMDWANEQIASGALDGPEARNPDGSPRTLRDLKYETEIRRLRSALRGAEIALARDGDIEGAMRCILSVDQQNKQEK